MSHTIPLEQIRIASPCHADWSAMQGDNRARYCGDCRKHVYDLSAMRREEAEALIREREGNLCVRYFQRRDGTILTADCPVGVRVRRRRAVLHAGAVVSVLASLSGAAADVTKNASVQERLGRRTHLQAGQNALVKKMGAIKAKLPARIPGKQTRSRKTKLTSVAPHPSASKVPPPQLLGKPAPPQAFMGAPSLSMRDMYRYFGPPTAQHPDAVSPQPVAPPQPAAPHPAQPVAPPANAAPDGFGVRGFLGGISLQQLQQQPPQQPAAPHEEPV